PDAACTARATVTPADWVTSLPPLPTSSSAPLAICSPAMATVVPSWTMASTSPLAASVQAKPATLPAADATSPSQRTAWCAVIAPAAAMLSVKTLLDTAGMSVTPFDDLDGGEVLDAGVGGLVRQGAVVHLELTRVHGVAGGRGKV